MFKAGVKVGHRAGRGRAPAPWSAGPIQFRGGQRQHAADEAIDQVADRHPPPGGVAAHPAFEERVDGRAEVGAEHEREAGLRRHDALGGEEDGQEHDGDAGSGRPRSMRGRGQDVDERVGGDSAQQEPQARHVLVGGDHGLQVGECDEHQAKADPDPAEIARAGDRAAAEHEDADEDEEETRTGDTSNDSTWTISVVPTLAPSMTASAGTSWTSPPAAKAVTMSPVAVLLWRTAVTPSPARKARNRLPSA